MERIPARLVLTFLGFLGYINLYGMRVNLSVAMVAMVRKPSLSNESNRTMNTCPDLIVYKNVSHDHETFILDGEFDWDSEIQGRVLGSFFYGYLITQIPAGVLAEKYGGKWIFGFGILINSLFTLLSPVAARWNVWALVAVRAIEGLAQGVVFPAMNVLISKWVPKMERSRLSTIIFTGIQTLLTNSLTGLLCESTFFGGWPSVFYISGTSGCVWFILWAVLAYESPDVHPRITKKELHYIQERTDKTVTRDTRVPWKSIWSSLPVWSVIVAHFGQNWAFYTLFTMLPTYLANVLHFEIKNNGLLSGLPYLMMAIFALPFSMTADKIRASGRLQITAIRKIFNSMAFFGPALCAVAIAFAGCYPTAIMVLFSLYLGLNSGSFSGYLVTHVDMSPRYAGTLFGITNAFATLPGFLAPALAGWMLSDGQTLKSWRLVFMTSSAFHILTGAFYAVFASAELQPWNSSEKAETVTIKSSSSRNGQIHSSKL